MKTFVINYETNYGVSVLIINSESLEEAGELAKLRGVWDGYEIEEVSHDDVGLIFEIHNKE